jgi:16S rRNA (cytidine1402-2'-O)-methyltransferase
MSKKGTLHLFPNFLGDLQADVQLTSAQLEKIKTLTHFIVEDEKTARRSLKRMGHEDLPNLQLYNMGKHSDLSLHAQEYLQVALTGTDMGLLSDAGAPCCADPGALVVEKAHQMGIPVLPWVGPSSILMALMASGLNGQQFQFWGYLPIDAEERNAKLKHIQQDCLKQGTTHIFIETPFRNEKIFQDLLKLDGRLKLSLSVDILFGKHYHFTQSIAQWQSAKKPELHKRHAVFLLGK